VAKSTEGLLTFDTVPDVRGFLGSWDELSSQFGAQSTALSRDALAAGLRLLEQSASSTAEWMQTCGQGSRRIGELAQAAERRVGAAEDVAGVWNLELGLLGETAQMAAASGQDAWLALTRTQAELMQSALAQGERAIEHWVRTANGAPPQAAATAAAAPDQPFVPFVPMMQWPAQWPAVAEAMTQGAQALMNAMAAAGQAALQTPAEPAPAIAAPTKQRTGARKR
jgi:hypothetical protein